MRYKVIWDNGINSSTYTTLESALLQIELIVVKGCTEVKLEVIKDRNE